MTNEIDDLERRARRRVGLKMGFYIHALAYLLVNTGLYAIDGLHGQQGWSRWPLMGWGLGLAIHGAVVAIGLAGEGIGRRMLEAERQALRRREQR